MKTKVSRRKVGLLVAALLLTLAPATALAQPLDSAYIVLFETRESAPVHAAPGNDLVPFPRLPGAFIPKDDTLTRIAQATLEGQVQAVGGGLLSDWNEVEVQGQSRIDWTSLQGSLSGVFHAETVTGRAVSGKLFNAEIDLSTLFTAGFGTVGGSWTTLGKNRIGGTFTGFVFAAVQIPTGTFVYFWGVDPDSCSLISDLAPAPVDKFGNGIARFDLCLFAGAP